MELDGNTEMGRLRKTPWYDAKQDMTSLVCLEKMYTGLEPVENENQGNSWLTHIH